MTNVIASLMIMLIACSTNAINIDFEASQNEFEKMPRFWINSGLAPPQPLNNAADFFESDDFLMNLQIIGSLPNDGIKNVRIHWLLNLLTISNYSETDMPTYNFTRMDKFLNRLVYDYRMIPTIEFMTTIEHRQLNMEVWSNLAYQFLMRYVGQFGLKIVSKWKFESWNEPDLESYNVFNFTFKDYQDYLFGLKKGFRLTQESIGTSRKFQLRGPAGLFKNEMNHPLCWGILNYCNENMYECPIDELSFHKKGNGTTANDISAGGRDLIIEFLTKFPRLAHLKYSNTEADPIKKWSEPRPFQSDVRYAAMTVETVFQHWNMMRDGDMRNLESISHDNSFMSYFPHQFNQRTLLARFQINNIESKYVEFVQKPVYGAFQMLSNIGKYAGKLAINEENLYLVSTNKKTRKFYANILIANHVNVENYKREPSNLNITISNLSITDFLYYVVEALDNNITNPAMIYENQGSPPYPTDVQFEAMRQAQNPIVIVPPTRVIRDNFQVIENLMQPYIVSIRICSSNVKNPRTVDNLRLTVLNEKELMLFWSEKYSKSRCVLEYEVHFKAANETLYNKLPYKSSVLYLQFPKTQSGCFKVRAKDIIGRYGDFSHPLCYKNYAKNVQ